MLKFRKTKEKNHKFESKTNKSISLDKNRINFQNAKTKKKNEDKKEKTNKPKIQISLKNNDYKKEKNTDIKFEKENPKILKEKIHLFKNKILSVSKNDKFNSINSISKGNKISKNLTLSKNSTKANKNRKEVISLQKYKAKERSKKKGNCPSDDIEKILLFVDDFDTIYRNKETLSTNYETFSTLENKIYFKPKKRIIKTRNRNRIEGKSQNKKIKNNFQKEKSNNKINDKSKDDKIKRREKRLSTVLTPIPVKIGKKEGNQIQINEKDIQNAIVLRRLEYNEYIKTLNKPKPKPQPKPKPTPRPKIYDINKVNRIQKVYKGFRNRDVNQIVNRLKVNLCANELFCLILNELFIHSKKRIIFSLLKLYYHEPFNSIYDEVNFTDRIYMKLSDRYYNFNNYVEEFF